MLPRFPFRRDNFAADDHLLFLFPSAFNSPLLSHHHFRAPCTVEHNYTFNLRVGFYVDTKKPAKKSFRVLAGVSYKPKRLCAT